MPKKYPVEIRLFAVQKKAEGHSWDKVAAMVREKFALDSPPSRRQMAKWVTARAALPEVALDDIARKLPQFGSKWLDSERGSLLGLFGEIMFRSKGFRINAAKWALTELKNELGDDILRTAWSQVMGEKKQSPPSGE